MEKTITLPSGRVVTASDLQEMIWDLRNKQANVSPDQRAKIQDYIRQLQAIMDKLTS